MQVSPALQKCITATEEKADTVESFKALFDSVHALIAEEKKDSAVVETNVASIGADLTKWLVEGGGFVHRGLCLERFGDSGNGFVATEEIATGEELFRVPLSHIMSVDTALEDPVLSQLQSQLSVLKQFGSPLLALYLLLEKLRPKSRWKPYLASLPVQYSVPLYWTWEDLLLLRGGTAWSQTLQMWKNAVRLFAVVRHVCTEHRTRLGIPAAPTFAQWRWALAAVFTRRNSIPAAHGAVLALIPVWDMCNHRSKGELTTGFDEQGKQVVCRAMERVESGKQVFIFYGQRSHADLLVNNGFLPDAEDERGDGCPNSSDYFSLRLSLNPNDALFARKKALLEENHKLPSTVDFAIVGGVFCIPSMALAFALISTMQVVDGKETTSDEQACGLLVLATTILLKKMPSLDEENPKSYVGQCAVRLRRIERFMMQKYIEQLQNHMAGLKRK